MGDSRVRFDSQKKCFTHKVKKEHTGIVVSPAQSTPYMVDDDTGERFSIAQESAKLYLPGDAVIFRSAHSAEPWDDPYLYANVTEVVEHSIAENNSDDGHARHDVSLLGFIQGGIDEGSDPWFSDDISVFGQSFHRFADGRTAASELFGEFLRGGQLESFSTHPVNPVQDVAPDFHVFR